jgi:hypothetical protein
MLFGERALLATVRVAHRKENIMSYSHLIPRGVSLAARFRSPTRGEDPGPGAFVSGAAVDRPLRKKHRGR